MTPDEAAALREPFHAAVIGKLPKGGTYLDYVGHAVVTDRLLKVDPEWTWEPVGFTDGLPAFDEHGGLWIRLTVAGVTRLGYGHPDRSTGGDSRKAAISDAIRNAAMRFGVALDLWAKEDMHATPTPSKPRATKDQVAAWGAALISAPDWPTLLGIAQELSQHDLGDAHANLVDAYTARKADLDAS